MPMLTIGALYGRIIGELLVIWFGEHFYYGTYSNKHFPGAFSQKHNSLLFAGDKYSDASDYKAWMDPGAIALIGAASFFAGVSRLTISLTVIMIEITNDVTMLLPIMTAIMVAKIVGDQLTHPIYHALLEVKCIPILDEEPVVYTQDPNGRSVL
jgi:chloride channel 7